ncbi:MAG: helix-turn-helix domain-containing protein [Actinomycetota bacterium]|nr:helix-turn-helix domain-containing protein [Actinomycetota bacterium]
MDETRESRWEELRRRRRRPRVAALTARVDAGEREALVELERRVFEDSQDLRCAGRPDLAAAARGWLRARIEDVERAREYAGRKTDAEAPARWEGLRVRISYLSPGGLDHLAELVGRLEKATERGLHVLIDELEEERDGTPAHFAGSIARRVKSERLLAWGALLSVQPLPIREVWAIEENACGDEEEVGRARESGDGKQDQARANGTKEGIGEGYAALGRFIKAQRRSRDLSMRELAEMSGLNLDTIANVEGAHHRPRAASLERLAQALVSAFEESESSRHPVPAEEDAEPGADDGVPLPLGRLREH